MSYEAPLSNVIIVASVVGVSNYPTAPDYPVLPPIPG